MAIVTNTQHKGQNRTDILSGSISIEEGNNRMVIREGGVEMLVITKDGIVLSDGTDRRMIIGKFPDDQIGVIVSKPGEDVVDIFS